MGFGGRVSSVDCKEAVSDVSIDVRDGPVTGGASEEGMVWVTRWILGNAWGECYCEG